NVKDALDELTTILENGAGVELVDNNDGTITLKSDDGTVLGTVEKADLTDNNDGTYTFDNGDGNPIIIDTNADAIAFDNSTNDFVSDNVQDALEELADALDAGAGVELKDNNDGTFTLESDNGDDLGTISKSDVTDHNDGSYTFDNGDGAPITFDVLRVDLSFNAADNHYEVRDKDGNVIGEIDVNADHIAYDGSQTGLGDDVQEAIDNLFDQLENTSDELVDNGDGTYTDTAYDGTTVINDANTTTVEEYDGVYTFKDGAGNTITTIDTNADAIAFDNSTNDFTSDNVQDALEELADALDAGAGVELKDNNDGTFTLESDNGDDLGTISKSDVTDHNDGSYTFDNGDGAPITFDVLRVDLSFNAADNQYEFRDKDGNVIGEIDVNADHI